MPALSTGAFYAGASLAAPTVPAQFGSGDWSVADDETSGDITITVAVLPSDGGSAILDLEYQIDGGSWISMAGTATGDYPVSGLTDDVEIDVAIRAVNAIGNGTASTTKAVTPTAFDVLGLPSLNRWYDPSDGSTVTNVSGACSQLNDKSGNARNVAQATAGSRPTIGGTINGVAALTFDGTADHLWRAEVSGIPGSGTDQPFTTFAVLEPAVVNVTQAFVAFALSSSFNTRTMSGILATGPAWFVQKSDNTPTSKTVSGGAPTAAPHLMTVICNGTTVTVRVDGIEVISSGDIDLGATTLNRFSLGAKYNETGSTGTFFSGKGGEVIVCTDDLGAPDVAACEAYLADKWGITI